jgi:ectoine hydroxylase-related dioxygenase (phytanoyl-CoA dioxygenase family)
MFEQYIADQAVEPVSHLPKRGDVLIWHGRLLHRGSAPKIPQMERRALIMHYSGIQHRQDMPAAEQSAYGGWYFPL